MTTGWKTGVLAAVLIAGTAAADAPDPQHVALAALAGHWDVTQSFYTKPGDPPQIDKGEADFAMVLNGRHLRQSLHIASKAPFEGLGYLGYDPTAGRWFSTWMDVNFSGLILAWGDYDAAAQTYTFTGTMAGKIPLREVLHVTDRDHFRYDYYEAHDGRESLAVRLDYARRR
jgi:hypothetical protein